MRENRDMVVWTVLDDDLRANSAVSACSYPFSLRAQN